MKHHARSLILALAILLLAAPAAMAEICDYQTAWGVLTIYYYDDNTLYGEYPGGTIDGYWYADGSMDGMWYQSDSRGYYSFGLTDWGFIGTWMYDYDADWRGDWDGDILGCY